MDGADVARVETVFTAHVGRVAGEAVDVAVMVDALSGVARRAEVAGEAASLGFRAVVSVGVYVDAGRRVPGARSPGRVGWVVVSGALVVRRVASHWWGGRCGCCWL